MSRETTYFRQYSITLKSYYYRKFKEKLNWPFDSPWNEMNSGFPFCLYLFSLYFYIIQVLSRQPLRWAFSTSNWLFNQYLVCFCIIRPGREEENDVVRQNNVIFFIIIIKIHSVRLYTFGTLWGLKQINLNPCRF